MNLFYKGYESSCEWDDLDNLYYGRLLGITDGVGFHGETKKQFQKAFEEAVDDYIETCQKVGKEPQRPKENVMEKEPPIDLSKVKASDVVDTVTENNPANESDKSSGGASGTTDPKSNPKDKPVNDTLTGY